MNVFRWRGIIEGFYGQPWSLDARRDMFRFMADHGLNVYVYAPKLDPYHREKWAEPYPEDLLAGFGDLVKAADDQGVVFVFALSPGLSIDYSSEQDRQRLLKKCRYLQQLGVKGFGLFFDDIPEEPTAQLARRQAQLTNGLWQALNRHSSETLELFFCPTKYQGDGDSDYVRALGDDLSQSVEVFWTGPHVCSQELTVGLTKQVSEALKRPVLFWDNYPVNDALMGAELHIGPYTGRAANLAEYSSGVIANPMEFPEASKIALSTMAAYLRHPAEYQSIPAWEQSLAAIGGEHSAALQRFAQANLISALHPEDPPRIQAAIATYKEKASSFDFVGAVTGLTEFFTEMLADAKAVRELPNRALVAEIEPWLRDYQRWAECGLQTLDIMGGAFSLLLDPPADEKSRQEMHQQMVQSRNQLGLVLKEAIDWPTKVCGDGIRSFCHEVYRSTAPYLS